MTDFRLVLQEPGGDELRELFRDHARDAGRVRIASAFISTFAAEGILEAVPPGVRPTIVVGREPSPSQMDALELLRDKADVRLWIGKAAFHPKVYVFEGDECTRVIIGSSNFTDGGFRANVEANVVVSLPPTDPMIVMLLERFDAWLASSAAVTDDWVIALRRLARVIDLAQALIDDDAEARSAKAEIERLIAAEQDRGKEAAEATKKLEHVRDTYFGFTDAQWHSLVDAGYSSLVDAARRNRYLTYSELAAIVSRETGLSVGPHDHAMNRILGDIASRSFRERGVVITALVLYTDNTEPGGGFFGVSKELGALSTGELSDEEKTEFHIAQMNATYRAYSQP